MNDNDYTKLIGIVVDNAKDILNCKPELREDEGAFHDRLFDTVLTEIDDFHADLSKYEAREISEVCGEVEGDILHGDILGL